MFFCHSLKMSGSFLPTHIHLVGWKQTFLFQDLDVLLFHLSCYRLKLDPIVFAPKQRQVDEGTYFASELLLKQKNGGQWGMK